MHRYVTSPSSLVGRAPLTLLGLVVLSIVLTMLVSSASSSVVWRGSFETGNLSQWDLGLQAKDPSRATVQSAIVREGRYATRIEVRPGDNNVAGSGSGERTDLLIKRTTTQGYEGEEQYWAWSVFFPSDFDAPGGGWNAFTGFHHTGTTGQSNMHFSVNDMARIELRAMGGDFAAPVRKDFVLAPLQKGQWYDFVFHVKWSPDPGVGFVQAWVNGREVVPKTMTPTLYHGQGVYLKQGYYRSAYPRPTVIYLDGTRRGASYDEVAAEFPSTTPASAPPPYAVTQNIAGGSTLRGTTTWTAATTGAEAALVRFKVDGVVVGTDTSAPFSMSLETDRLDDGQHAFRVEATDGSGQTVTATVSADVANSAGTVGKTADDTGIANRAPSSTLGVTQSLDEGQVLSGELVWTAAPTGRDVNRIEFSIDGRVVSTERLRPYVFGGDDAKLDTRKLSNGAHSLAVKAFAVDGSTATAVVAVKVANGAVRSSTLGVTQSLDEGQVLSGELVWTAAPTGRDVNRIEFSIDGRVVSTERLRPYVFGGDDAKLDTRKLSNGAHSLAVKAFAVDGSTATAVVAVTVANGSPSPTPPTSAPATPAPTTPAPATPAPATPAPATPAPSAPSGAPAADGPKLFSSIEDGQSIRGRTDWVVRTTGTPVDRIEYYIDGRLRWTERHSPFVFGGDDSWLDADDLSKGGHVFELKAYGTNGAVSYLKLRVKAR